jgi:hypothetical protein
MTILENRRKASYNVQAVMVRAEAHSIGVELDRRHLVIVRSFKMIRAQGLIKDLWEVLELLELSLPCLSVIILT